MAEYIDRDGLLEEIEAAEKHGGMGSVVAGTLRRYVKRMPAADIVPVVHGEWIEAVTQTGDKCVECSVCHEHENPNAVIKGRFCWHCGAKMDGKEPNHDR